MCFESGSTCFVTTRSAAGILPSIDLSDSESWVPYCFEATVYCPVSIGAFSAPGWLAQVWRRSVDLEEGVGGVCSVIWSRTEGAAEGVLPRLHALNIYTPTAVAVVRAAVAVVHGAVLPFFTLVKSTVYV